MKILSVNVGLPRDVEWRGEAVRTSIYKEPVTGPVRVGRLNLEGDRQGGRSAGRSGFYLAVLQEGELAAGESMEFSGRDEHGVTVADVVSLYASDATNQGLLRRVSDLPALPEGWRDYFRKRLWEPDA